MLNVSVHLLCLICARLHYCQIFAHQITLLPLHICVIIGAGTQSECSKSAELLFL